MLVIGMGLGATVIASRLAAVGADVVMLPGVGRSRSTHLDGGRIEHTILERAFPHYHSAPVESLGDYEIFRRDLMERWAIDHCQGYVTVVEDFDEAHILPNESDGMTVTDVTGNREITSRLVVLSEGANPKIGMAARLRPDFDPEDMIHFGRAFITGGRISKALSGSWRTSWGMPAWYSTLPLADGIVVSASARIENIMRCGRDGKDTLKDFLASSVAREIGIIGTDADIGMELVSLQAGVRGIQLGVGNVVITPDANGLIDARSLDRFDMILRSAIRIGDELAAAWPDEPRWNELTHSILDMFATGRTPYHDSSETGFVEDGPGTKRGRLRQLFKR